MRKTRTVAEDNEILISAIDVVPQAALVVGRQAPFSGPERLAAIAVVRYLDQAPMLRATASI